MCRLRNTLVPIIFLLLIAKSDIPLLDKNFTPSFSSSEITHLLIIQVYFLFSNNSATLVTRQITTCPLLRKTVPPHPRLRTTGIADKEDSFS